MNLPELFHAIRCYPKLDSGVACKRVSISYRSFVVVKQSYYACTLRVYRMISSASPSSSTPPLPYLAEHLRTTRRYLFIPFWYDTLRWQVGPQREKQGVARTRTHRYG